MNILNLKKKSAHKFIQNQLKKLEKTKKVVPEKLKRIGIIADLRLWDAFDFIKDLENRLDPNGKQFQVLLFNSAMEKIRDQPYLSVSEDDIGMFGKFRNQDIKAFIDQDFDLLINYSDIDHYLIQVLLLRSKAKLKAGFFREDHDFYDISIKTPDNKIVVFNEELSRYLKIMGLLG
jgi:hypothetical protein